MKKFNKEITVTVSIDSIAQNLLEQFPEDYKHREIVTEAIIGSCQDNENALSNIYNTLNGYPCDVDFAVGDHVICTDYYWGYPDGKADESTRVDNGPATVLEIDPFKAKNKIRISYDKYTKDGVKEDTTWVNHQKCTKVNADVLVDADEVFEDA